MLAPLDYQYTQTHMWVHLGNDALCWVGVTDYAQEMLGDVVFVESPAIGVRIVKGQPCGVIESVKTSADLYAPLSGVVVAVNQAITANPELINDKPYQTWLFKIELASTNEAVELLNATQYQALVE